MEITTVWNPDIDTLLSIRDNVLRVDWYNAGEGICGDYNPNNSQDVNLLRFDVYIMENPEVGNDSDKSWRAVEDASYCTNMPTNVSKEILEKSLKYIFSEYRAVIDQYSYSSLKKLGERLSWISDLDFKSDGQKGAS